MTAKTLLLCANDKHGKKADFLEIKQYLKELAPSLKVIVTSNKLGPLSRWRYRRSNMISFLAWKNSLPKDVTLYSGQNLSKAEECERLEKAGLPVPRWHLWEENTELPAEIEEWGEYLVKKPNVGARGAEVKIVKRSRLKWKPLSVKYRNISSEPFLQEFIHTGPYPASYRIGTLFGEPLYCFRIDAPKDGPPLLDQSKYTKQGPEISRITANSKRSRYTLCDDTSIIDLAREAHKAFPNIPILGVDIIKDSKTGKLWVIETNASGFTWHLTSVAGQSIQEIHKIDLHSQFGGLTRAAEIIAKKFG